MHPFLTALIREIFCTMKMGDPEIKAFDVFNFLVDLTESETEEKTTALFEFYGWFKASNFWRRLDTILSTDTCDSKDFYFAKHEAAEKQNRVIMELVCKKETKSRRCWKLQTWTSSDSSWHLQKYGQKFSPLSRPNTTKYSAHWKRLFCVNHAAH